MNAKGIKLILIHIDEAHSIDAWPVNLLDAPLSHACIEDRIDRANKFIVEENPPFPTFVDTWSNGFANLYRAWPDKYYCINNDNKIICKSEYGSSEKDNAHIKVDCTQVIEELL